MTYLWDTRKVRSEDPQLGDDESPDLTEMNYALEQLSKIISREIKLPEIKKKDNE